MNVLMMQHKEVVVEGVSFDVYLMFLHAYYRL